jgi:hypothetical protein
MISDNHLNNSIIGSPVQALGYGTWHNDESVAAMSVIFTFLVTEARFTVHPYQINGTWESYSYGEL